MGLPAGGGRIRERSRLVIVWLASYPRSGNNMLRFALYYLFGVKSASEYDQPLHEPLHESILSRDQVDALREGGSAVLVKTHELAAAGDRSPAIYVVRDGRDAVVSYAHFAKASGEAGFEDRSFEESLETLILQREPFGTWSENVRSWTRRDAPTSIARFEELVEDPADTVSRAAEAVGISLGGASGEAPSFEDLRDLNQVLFRRGVAGSWRSEMPPHLEALFWEHHGAEMQALGYSRE
jgi:sulfotransferase family protein